MVYYPTLKATYFNQLKNKYLKLGILLHGKNEL